ncbi:MAG: hypothetical protein MJE68_30715 [Proteobacteria bacterium]|nr:hypothetical protein [Pseudomonadota bacterium]
MARVKPRLTANKSLAPPPPEFPADYRHFPTPNNAGYHPNNAPAGCDAGAVRIASADKCAWATVTRPNA